MTPNVKCLECNSVLEQFKTGGKPFCNTECETKFNMVELKPPSEKWTCLECNGPLGFEPQMCCTNGEWTNPNSPCGCMGMPIDPPFCSNGCQEKWESKCQNCEGDGWVSVRGDAIDQCPDCKGSGKRKK